ncbi:MAG: hypothetical protein OXF67_07605 [Cyanobacteria bacterium MAG CAR4_bin_6]|nr:hypothetical protein [Cyanobacteria bacterium MAG CAR4_bin_6]
MAWALAQFWAGQALGGGDWLLLDEPTTHLDLAHQAAVIRIAHQVAAAGAGVVAVVHDLTVAAALAHHVVLLQAGCGQPTGRPGSCRPSFWSRCTAYPCCTTNPQPEGRQSFPSSLWDPDRRRWGMGKRGNPEPVCTIAPC